jgi:hypothetical protein
LYLTVSDHTVAVQHGLMPLAAADYAKYPFTAGADKKNFAGSVSLRVESFHNAVGCLRCFDATKTTPDKKPHFNWWDRDNCFIAGLKKAPQYTHLFWVLFFKVAANLGDKGKQIVGATTPAAIDALRAEMVKVVKQEGAELMTVEIPLISAEIRAMVDNICYMSVYGHRTTFEKIPVTRRAAFNEYTLRIAKDYEDEFYNSWKSYRAENPAETAERNPGGDSDVERLINALDGSDDEPDGAAAAAAAAVPASDDGAAGAAVRE